ncbi:MAG: 2,3,4,5-tetrahydropyridine-2,6-dicarboxylate N-succinyltransferase, partial [Acidimicrobiia bacterium]|nr:2,3,4,5-tetrahydropyridine-2,6-dicarboxylate N-succinyltransferase [Acidimicrobiia bacterium]
MSEQELIESAYAGEIDIEDAREAVMRTIARLDAGEVRVAEKRDGTWTVNGWVKEAILLYFRLQQMETMEVGAFEFCDKIPLKKGLKAQGVRVVPPGTVRYGAHCEP